MSFVYNFHTFKIQDFKSDQVEKIYNTFDRNKFSITRKTQKK